MKEQKLLEFEQFEITSFYWQIYITILEQEENKKSRLSARAKAKEERKQRKLTKQRRQTGIYGSEDIDASETFSSKTSDHSVKQTPKRESTTSVYRKDSGSAKSEKYQRKMSTNVMKAESVAQISKASKKPSKPNTDEVKEGSVKNRKSKIKHSLQHTDTDSSLQTLELKKAKKGKGNKDKKSK